MSIDYSKYAPEFEIHINGKKDDILRQSVTSITITEDLQSATSFQFTINDEFNVDKGQFLWFDNKSLQPGKKLSIKMGYVGHLLDLLPIGSIENVTTTGFTQASNPSMTVSGYDECKKILNEKPNSKDKTTNRKLKGSEIIDLIESKYNAKTDLNLRKTIEATQELAAHVTKNSLNTYGDILANQAQKIGWTYFMTRGNIYYVNPRKKKEPILAFEWGQNLIEFVPQINTSDINRGLRVRSSSPTSNQAIEMEVATGSEDRWDNDGITASQLAENMERETRDEEIQCSDKKEAEIRAKAMLNQQSDNLVTGNCKIIGTPELEIGQMIKIKGVGKRFSGDYFVTNVTNEISSSGYLTNFSVRTNTVK